MQGVWNRKSLEQQSQSRILVFNGSKQTLSHASQVSLLSSSVCLC